MRPTEQFSEKRSEKPSEELSDPRDPDSSIAANEHLMVAVSRSPFSQHLIRATHRLALNLEASWIAVHVNDGTVLSDEDQTQLSQNITLARELNAEVITTTDPDVPEALKRVARQKSVTQIVVGRPTKRVVSDVVHGGTLLDRLVRDSFAVDVHVIRQDNATPAPASWWRRLHLVSRPLSYWNAFWFLFGVSFVNGLLDPLLGYRTVGFVFLLGVMVVGLFASVGPTLFVAIASALIWNFFFIPPRFTFAIRDPADIILCLAYLKVATIMGYLTNRIRTHERMLREREDRTNALYEVGQDIANHREKADFLPRINRRVGRLLDGECGVLLRGSDGKLQLHAHKAYSPLLSENEGTVATWAFESGKVAGWSTEKLSEAKALYIPLASPNGTVGVLVYEPHTQRKLSLEQEGLLFAIGGQLAVSLERHFLEKRLRETERLEVSEKLHQTLLNSISHEMRTPLTAIVGIATALEDESGAKNSVFVKAMADQLVEASDRLNRVIENLLDMSRLNSGVLALKQEWQDLHDLVGVTLAKVGKNLAQHRLITELPKDLPLVKMDLRLMEHALSNLLLNAAIYAVPGSEIRISVQVLGEAVELVIEDSGPGIPEPLWDKVFEKFFRVPGSPTGGTGLGLSIVKGIAEIHNGRASVTNRSSGGARFSILLPATTPPPAPEEQL